MDYIRKVSDKNAYQLQICVCRSKQLNNILEQPYYMHGSPKNGWLNELFGDFHAESHLGGLKVRQDALGNWYAGSLRWRWGKIPPGTTSTTAIVY